MSSTNDVFHTPVIECICTLCLCYCTLQRRAARFVLSRYRNTSRVNSMLEALDRPTLERHRQISRLYMLYKIIIGLVRCPILKAKLPASSHATAEDTTGSQAHHCKKAAQERFVFTQNHQGLDLPAQGSSWGHHTWHFCVKGLLPINPRNYPPLPPAPTPTPSSTDSEHTNWTSVRTSRQVSRRQNDQPFERGPSTWRTKQCH